MLGRIVTIIVFTLASALPLSAQDPAVLRIGAADARTNELSPGQKSFLDAEFPRMVEEFTGLKSTLHMGGSAFEGARKLESGEWHMAIFQGVELGWVRGRDPKITPLMLAIYQTFDIHAELVVKKDSSEKSVAALKGKTLALLQQEHTDLFADKLANGKAKEFFAKIERTTNSEEALDNVLLGKAAAAMVDNVALEIYKDIHPGRFARTRVLAKSELFPSPGIAYRQGVLSDKLLTRFKTGMFKANKSEKGRDAMANFQISSFEPVPANYDKHLRDIVAAYPPPKE
jgi:ABC-type phosphate/phosphonate transport system substrate-binding protein